MKQARDYKLEIFWSTEDECFIANFPEIQFCSAFGDTREQALAEAEVALGLTLDSDSVQKDAPKDSIEEVVQCKKCRGNIYEDQGECLREMLCDDCLRARENPEIYGEEDEDQP